MSDQPPAPPPPPAAPGSPAASSDGRGKRSRLVAPEAFTAVNQRIEEQMRVSRAEAAKLSRQAKVASRQSKKFRRTANSLSMEDLAMIAECRGMAEQLEEVKESAAIAARSRQREGPESSEEAPEHQPAAGAPEEEQGGDN